MATHSSILAQEIPRKEEPGRLQSMGHKESDTTEQSTTHRRNRREKHAGNNLGNVNGEAGAGNNNTVGDGGFYPVITGLQQRARLHFQEFYKMIIKHSHLCNWP